MERNFNAMIETLENKKIRSAWVRGVKAYAVDMLSKLYTNIADGWYTEPTNRKELEKTLLNGAKDWKQYSYGGCALCYDGQIVETLCTESEKKRYYAGKLNKPNSNETWIDCQARALYQAFLMVCEIYFQN